MLTENLFRSQKMGNYSLDFFQFNPENNLAIAIPTQGDRHTLKELLSVINSYKFPKTQLLVALNGNLQQSDFIVRKPYTVVQVPSGYSSSRNAAAQYAKKAGAGAVLFIDDDVVVDKQILGSFIEFCSKQEHSLVSLRVDKFFNKSAKSFTDLVLSPKLGSGKITSLSGSFLFVPIELFNDGGFPPSLDFTGAEDTAFTMSAQKRGYKLIEFPNGSAYEIHGANRTSNVELVSRMLASQAVRVMLKRRGSPWHWKLGNKDINLFWVIRTIARVASISPLIGYYTTAVSGRVFGLLSIVPIKVGSKWATFRKIE